MPVSLGEGQMVKTETEDEWTDGSSQRSSVGVDHFGECSYYCQNYIVALEGWQLHYKSKIMVFQGVFRTESGGAYP